MNPVVSLLQQLTRIPSVSPMGKELPIDSDIVGERRVTEFLIEWGASRAVDVTRQTVSPWRDNVVFSMEGDRPGVLLWEVHQDTVPVDGMTIDPFGGELRDGKVYGRGACDVKGTMACMLTALDELLGAPSSERPTILLACTVDEEQGGSGASALPDLWSANASSGMANASSGMANTSSGMANTSSGMASLPKPDAAVVAEPTELDVVVAHKGVTRWCCRTKGQAAHSSNPSAGDNAIYRMAEVVGELNRYHREVLDRADPHPLLGPPSLSVGTIHGGAGVNLVADHCEVEIDRRLLPSESPLEAQQQAIEYLATQGLSHANIIHDPPYLESGGLSDQDNQPLAEQLSAAARAAGGRGERIGVAFGTDASRLSPYVPCVVFGAGNIAQAHTVDEWIDVDQLQMVTDALVRFVLAWQP